MVEWNLHELSRSYNNDNQIQLNPGARGLCSNSPQTGLG